LTEKTNATLDFDCSFPFTVSFKTTSNSIGIVQLWNGIGEILCSYFSCAYSGDTIRQRLKEWCYDKEDKKGERRAELNVESCFPCCVGL